MRCHYRLCTGHGYVPLLHIKPQNADAFTPVHMTLANLYDHMESGAYIQVFTLFCDCHRDSLSKHFLSLYNNRRVRSPEPPAESYISYYREYWGGRFKRQNQIIIPSDMLVADYTHDVMMAVDTWRVNGEKYHYIDRGKLLKPKGRAYDEYSAIGRV